MARARATTDSEALPEIDRLEGVPHPRETQTLFGHEMAERTLAEALGSGRMHHGWLLTGRDGIGKATLAYRFARAALAHPDERDPKCQSLTISDNTIASHQVRSLSHPGLLIIRRSFDVKTKRFTTSISTEAVRRLRSFLAHRTADDTWRIVIVDKADELNLNAANALLKSLEEPPPGTVFLLVSATPGRLLPTIRSRCRTLILQPLSNDALRVAATQALLAGGQEQPGVADWPILERLADGSVGRLLGLWAAGGLEQNRRISKLTEGLPKIDWRSVHALADDLQPAAAQQHFDLFFELFLGHLARLIRAQVTDEGTPAERELAGRLIGEGRLASFAALWERVAREKAETVALNLDRKTLILDTVSGLVEAAQR